MSSYEELRAAQKSTEAFQAWIDQAIQEGGEKLDAIVDQVMMGFLEQKEAETLFTHSSEILKPFEAAHERRKKEHEKSALATYSADSLLDLTALAGKSDTEKAAILQKWMAGQKEAACMKKELEAQRKAAGDTAPASPTEKSPASPAPAESLFAAEAALKQAPAELLRGLASLVLAQHNKRLLDQDGVITDQDGRIVDCQTLEQNMSSYQGWAQYSLCMAARMYKTQEASLDLGSICFFHNRSLHSQGSAVPKDLLALKQQVLAWAQDDTHPQSVRAKWVVAQSQWSELSNVDRAVHLLQVYHHLRQQLPEEWMDGRVALRRSFEQLVQSVQMQCSSELCAPFEYTSVRLNSSLRKEMFEKWTPSQRSQVKSVMDRDPTLGALEKQSYATQLMAAQVQRATALSVRKEPACSGWRRLSALATAFRSNGKRDETEAKSDATAADARASQELVSEA